MALPRGSRTLLVGDNGAGKSTLLRILSGRHMHERGAVTVLGRESFFDTALNESRAYLGTDWGKRTVAFSGHGQPLMADIGVAEMMVELQAEFRPRRDELVALLGIDLEWRMHQLSDGQRRRVQIMLQLLRPVEILLLDEITTDLDLLTRQDFLSHLRVMSERDGVTVVYATHIFDGLDEWPTHLAFISDGALARFGDIASYDDLAAARARGVVAPLLRTIETWMRKHRDERRAKGMSLLEKAAGGAVDELRGTVTGNGYLSGRLGGIGDGEGAAARGAHN
jgi:CCR4-NOT complex subunit CAF16